MRGALCGALVFEGDAADLDEASRIVDAGDVELSPCHSVGGVGAMAGITSPSMPVCVLESSSGQTTFCALNEGIGKALRFGTTDEQTLKRLRWLRDVAMPVLDRGVGKTGPVDVTALQQEGLRRGDECHNRNVASSAALLLRLVRGIVAANSDTSLLAEVLDWATGNPHFFLPFSMASAKGVALSAQGFDGDPTVTAMAGNGVEFGIQVSGLGERWFCAPAPLTGVRCFEGYTIADAQAAMGDSFITEVIGLGAFSLSAAPAIGSFLGTDNSTGHAVVEEMRTICRATSTRFNNPFEDFAGAPIAIDVRRVVSSRTAPMVNNGVAHRLAGIGQIGAGLTRLPLEPFEKALALLDAGHLGSSTER
ncbi:MAG: DUF1116 domain-containing protein [Acidimicrobiales bacterium]